MPVICQKRDCGKPATHAIKFCVPGAFDTEDAPPRASILLGVVVCEECLDGETAEKWLDSAGDTLRPLCAISMAGTIPDFERAVITGVSLASPEYGALVIEGLNAPKAN